MKIIIDEAERTLTVEAGEGREVLGLYSAAAFELINRFWVKIGWDLKYSYSFSWAGRPIIQLPDDMVRIQEVIYRVRPDVIIETGIAHGGSLVFYASLCRLMDHGRVVGIDIEIRPHNRKAIEAHELFPLITLVEGSSIDPDVVEQVKGMVKPGEKVLVILDSCHTRAYVKDELEAYEGLVSPGSYIVVADGVMRDLYDVPRGKAEWEQDNPTQAARDFLAERLDFVLEPLEPLFNESALDHSATYWPEAWLKRK
jgi:cephalosporin hydroxylase